MDECLSMHNASKKEISNYEENKSAVQESNSFLPFRIRNYANPVPMLPEKQLE